MMNEIFWLFLALTAVILMSFNHAKKYLCQYISGYIVNAVKPMNDATESYHKAKNMIVQLENKLLEQDKLNLNQILQHKLNLEKAKAEMNRNLEQEIREHLLDNREKNLRSIEAVKKQVIAKFFLHSIKETVEEFNNNQEISSLFMTQTLNKLKQLNSREL